MSIKNENLYTISQEQIQPGQKVIRFKNNIWLPIGFNSNSGSGSGQVILGYVDDEGKFQALSFIGETPSDSGNAETVQNYKSWNSTIPVPAANGNMSQIDVFDWMQILN